MTYFLATTPRMAAWIVGVGLALMFATPLPFAADSEVNCTDAAGATGHSYVGNKASPLSRCWLQWCPDDYCSKSLPCIPSLRSWFGCDDYCPKPSPNVCWPRTGFCPDDYCRKESPDLCWPVSPWLRCFPSE